MDPRIRIQVQNTCSVVLFEAHPQPPLSGKLGNNRFVYLPGGHMTDIQNALLLLNAALESDPLLVVEQLGHHQGFAARKTKLRAA